MYDDKSVFAKELLGTIRESIKQLYCWYRKIHDQIVNYGQPLASGGENVSHDETNAAYVARPSRMARANDFHQHL